MRNFLKIFCFLFVVLSAENTYAVYTVPNFSTQSITSPIIKGAPHFSPLKVKQVEILLGRKLKFKEKIALKIYNWKEKSKTKTHETEPGKKGKTSYVLGILALSGIVVPFIGIFSIPLAIFAIVFGNQARKINPQDKKAKTGILLGWITLGVIVLAAITIIALVSTFAIH